MVKTTLDKILISGTQLSLWSNCTGKRDGDLNLFLVSGGRLRYQCNASNEGVSEKRSARPSGITIIHIGREAKISLILETVREVNFTLYNAVWQRVMAAAKKPQDGKVSFHISQSPGVYFYRIKTAKQDLKGKVVLY